MRKETVDNDILVIVTVAVAIFIINIVNRIGKTGSKSDCNIIRHRNITESPEDGNKNRASTGNLHRAIAIVLVVAKVIVVAIQENRFQYHLQ